MPVLSDITPLVLTWNEAANIERTLARLGWARRVVVVDSGSTDETVAICGRYPQVDVVTRAFDDHTSQWNFGLDQVTTEWVLALDADYVLSEDLVAELGEVPDTPAIDGYLARFTYCVRGRPLRASIYPPRVVLFRTARCRYVPDGHTQRLQVAGGSGELRGRVLHDDRKGIDRWFLDQLRYSAHEARLLAETPRSQLNAADRIRRAILPAPALVCAYVLFGKGLVLDGWPGCYYAMQRTLAELLLSVRLLESRLRD